ncbi:MAG TPA: septum site-determining protein Ssd [Microlunatus sp.]
MDASAYAAVLTGDEELLDRLLATLAAVGMEPRVLSDPGALRAVWRDATAVAVGGDRAEQLVALGLPRRSDVFVVGDDSDSDELCRWSVPLGAAVAPLPSSDAWFATALADAAGLRTGAGRLVAVVGSTGGVGGSTCATALALAAAGAGQRTVLVDGDPLGGGLDLLVGAEHVDGWRWPHLSHARGHLGDLTGQLPYVDGVDLLAAARRGGQSGLEEIGAEQMAAVLRSTTRSHDLTVVDVPRWLSAVGLETTRRADLTVLVVRADLRGLAAARELVAWLPESSAQVLLRGRRSAAVGPELVEESLGLPVLAIVADEAAVRLAAERGEPPSRAARSALAKACREVLDQLPRRTDAT